MVASLYILSNDGHWYGEGQQCSLFNTVGMNVHKWSEIQVCPLCVLLVNPLTLSLPMGWWAQESIMEGCTIDVCKHIAFLRKAAPVPVQTYM